MTQPAGPGTATPAAFGPPVSVPSGLPAPQPGTAAGAPAPVHGRRAEVNLWYGTPGRLRIAALAAVLASLVFALLGGYAFRDWSAAMDDARADAAQLVRVQTIQNDLVKADAAAANAYLQGGTDTTGSRATYVAAIRSAAEALAQPAATTADSNALATAVSGLTDYTGLIEQARANNRQGLQIGAAYQRQAGDILRSQIVPALQTVSAADQARVGDAYGRADRASGLLVLAVGLALLVLVLVQVWLARRTHRILSPALVLATLAVLASAVGGAVVLNGTAQDADRVATGPYAATVALSAARTDAFDAKAREALGLIRRGDAGQDETIAEQRIKDAEAQSATAQRLGAAGVVGAFTTWTSVHDEVRSADDAGDWSGAKQLAVGGSNTAFTSFDEVSGTALAAVAAKVDTGLGGHSTALRIAGWLTVALGVLAALASWRGIDRRLEDYR